MPLEDKLVIMGGGGEPSDVSSDVIPLSNGFCNGISCNGIKHSKFLIIVFCFIHTYILHTHEHVHTRIQRRTRYVRFLHGNV